MHSLIFDTSALFNFGHRGQMEALLTEFGRCYRLVTTAEVKSELCGPPRRQYYEKLVDDHLRIQKVKDVKLSIDQLRPLARMLASGELSVILLALDLGNVARAVIDEKPARREAAALGVEVTGTIGLLKEAVDRGWRTDAECVKAVRLLVERKFRVREPAPGEAFSDYFKSFSQL
jgi:predicted nucleic acid-binding protein